MEEEVLGILIKYVDNPVKVLSAKKEIMFLLNAKIGFEKQKIDNVLNFVRGELSIENNCKLDKFPSPYREDKIKFLNKVIKLTTEWKNKKS